MSASSSHDSNRALLLGSPKGFGNDDGFFWKKYDDLAETLDNNMVKSLKTQLDGILIFAGLFAGVNSAFLALTLPQMSANPADDTNALLLALVTGRNDTIRSEQDLPSANFNPPRYILPINILFSLSLTLAIISSFLAVLGQQWLVSYRRKSGGGEEGQRREQLLRYLGAERWRMKEILNDVLPALLQLGLTVFCIAFAIYLGTMSKVMCYAVTGPMAFAIAVLFVMTVAAAWDRWCPFKSPLSHLLHSVGHVVVDIEGDKKKGSKYSVGMIWIILAMIGFSILIGVRNIIYNSVTFLIHQTWKRSAKPVKYFPVNLEILRTAWDIAQAFGQRRPAEDTSVRTAAAVRRVLCTSEENETLICTAAKVEAIDSDKEAQCLLEDAIIYGRLLELISYPEEYRKLSPAFTRAFANILARGCSISLLVEPSHRHLYPKSGSLAKIGEFGTRTHPLQWNIENVHTALEHGEGPLDKSTSSVATLRLFFDLLHIVLADGSGDTEFGHWFSRVTGRFSPAEQCPVAMIRAVSAMMHLLRGDLLPLRLGEGSFFARRCLRIGAVKELIHGAIWKVPVEQRNQDVWVSLLELIDNALLPPSSALPKQQHFEMEKWTLDHTLNIACGVVNSEADCNAQPLRLVRLLRSLDNLDSLDVGNNSSESNGLDNRARTRNTCVRSLSQCLTRLSLAQQTFGSLGNEFLEHMFAHLRDFKINITRSRQLRLLDEALLSEWDACWVALPDPSTHQGDHLPESHKSAFQYYQKRYPQLRADYQDLRTTLIQRLRTNSNRTMPTTSSPVGGLSAQEPEQQFRATTYASTTSGLLLPTPSPGQEAYTEG